MKSENDIIEMESGDKVSILINMEKSHRQELVHHRNLQFRAFSWTNGLLLAVFGGLIAAQKSGIQVGLIVNIALTIVILSITITTLILIANSSRALETNAKVIIDIDKKLGLFTSNFFKGDNSVYPQKWLKWGSGERRASLESWFFLMNTIVLGASIIIVSWYTI